MPRVEEQVGNRRRPDDRRAVWRHWTQSAPEIRGRLIVGGAGKQVVQRMAQRALAPCRERAVESRQFRHAADRSEEHTSELQSLMRISYAVFCLKKKKNNNDRHSKTNTRRQ